jgi:hypothetical protein
VKKSLAEYSKKQGRSIDPYYKESFERFLSDLDNLEAGKKESYTYFEARGANEYRAYKEFDGTIAVYLKYPFSIIEAPEGHYYQAIANQEKGLRIYLCKDGAKNGKKRAKTAQSEPGAPPE